MIRTYDLSPQEQLSRALGGTILGPSAIAVGTTIIHTSPTGKVRVGSTVIGCWFDDTAALAEAARVVMGGAACEHEWMFATTVDVAVCRHCGTCKKVRR
jgi:hypothetical protein